MESVKHLLQGWIEQGLLPGAALRVVHRGEIVFAHEAGVAHLIRRQPVTADTLYDLASLTKVTATLPALLLLMQEGRLSPADAIGDFFPDAPEDKQSITVAQLLSHTSGLPADLEVRKRDQVIQLPTLLYEQTLLYEPGSQVVYSDLGMIWLGLLLERVTGESLDLFAARRIFSPLGMEHTLYCPKKDYFPNVASTEFCTIAGDYLVGEVHDEKAYAMGGVAGHAGLFGTADDLARYAMSWLYDEQAIISAKWRREAIRCHTPGLGKDRGYGWERNGRGQDNSCGSGFHPDSFGHTGFTGTSVWIDPVHDWAVVFLTNAVHLGRNHQLRTLRPLLHDAVTAELARSLT